MRIVLDTNIWISGLLLPDIMAGTLLSYWRKDHFGIVTSQFILDEIKRVLSYPKIRKRLQWNENKIDRYLNLLTFFTEVIDTSKTTIKVISDPNDSHVLATLVMSKADFLVTGDRDLLVLQPEHPIISLTEFCKTMGIIQP